MQNDDSTTGGDSSPEYVQRGNRDTREDQEVEITSAEIVERDPNETSLDKVYLNDDQNRLSDWSEMKGTINKLYF